MTARLLGWVVGPVGKCAVAALLFAGWTVFHRADAARAARADCELGQVEAALAAEVARTNRAELIAATARLRADKAQIEVKELEGINNELLEELRSQGAQCDIPDELRDRLLGIR